MIDQTLMTLVQYALLEAPNGGLGWTEGVWTKDEMYAYLTLRQQALLKQTHLLVGMAEIPGVIGTSRYDLPDDWIATVVVAWQDTATGRVRELLPSEMHRADLGLSTWEAENATPIVYTDADTPTRTIQIIPAPDVAGTVQLVYVPLSTRPTGGDEEPLQPPNEWCYGVLKYGILADALGKVGRMQDVSRAGYCRWREQLGVEVTRLLLSGGA